jgi:hypothetical protein
MSGPGPRDNRSNWSDVEPTDDSDGPTYNPRTDTYVDGCDGREASVAVMESLADIRHCVPTELEPLYQSVDPDALDSLIRSASPSLRVQIDLDGFEVVVTGAGRLEITPPS